MDAEKGHVPSTKANGGASQDDLSPPAVKKQKIVDDKKMKLEKNLAALEQSLDLSVLDTLGNPESENPKSTSSVQINQNENPPPSELKKDIREECPVPSEPQNVSSDHVTANFGSKKPDLQETKKKKKHRWSEE